jgi:hypothetical protein
MHCKSGDAVLLQPDGARRAVRATREPGGYRIDGRSVRYTELTHPPKAARDFTTVDYIFALKGRSAATRELVKSPSRCGFLSATWLDMLRAQGFLHVRSSFLRVVFFFSRVVLASRATCRHTQARTHETLSDRDQKIFRETFFAESSRLRFEFPPRSVCGVFPSRLQCNF